MTASRLGKVIRRAGQRLTMPWRRARSALRFFGQDVTIGKNTYISPRARIELNGGGSITIGDNCEINDYSMIMTYGGHVVLGNHCSLNPFSIIYGHGGVAVGNSVRIAAHCVLISANHNTPAEGEALHDSGVSSQGITIGTDVWLGSGVRVLDGVSIGDKSVVGAGGVVTRSVPPKSVVGGVPARPLERR